MINQSGIVVTTEASDAIALPTNIVRGFEVWGGDGQPGTALNCYWRAWEQRQEKAQDFPLPILL
jgi:hypothetical protein